MRDMLQPVAASSVETRGGEAQLVRALRAGDERAFADLHVRLEPTMTHVARSIVGNRDVAEEVVQDTWLGVVSGIDRFEGRSTLKTWIFRILTNTAISRAARLGRSAPFSAFQASGDEGSGEPTVDADSFLSPDGRWRSLWASASRRSSDLPEQRVLSRELVESLTAAILALPPVQRSVITMRDVEGCPSDEVCAALTVTAANQRVLLHRARSRVRAVLDERVG